MTLVLDVSVAVKWFFLDEPLRAQALAVRADVAQRADRFVVPHLFMSELAHVLARKSKRDEAFVSASLALILRLGLRTLSLSAGDWSRVCTWSAHGLTGYDATYVALAEACEGRWLTADDQALSRLPLSLRAPLHAFEPLAC